MKKELDKFKFHLEETSNELAPLKVWQFQELSLQAADRIMTAPKDEALKVLIQIAQNFPIQVSFTYFHIIKRKDLHLVHTTTRTYICLHTQWRSVLHLLISTVLSVFFQQFITH